MVKQMTTLNKVGEALGKIEGVNAMTDVTGFGLIGHLIEMAEGSGVTAELNISKLLLVDGIKEYLAQKNIPGGTVRNWSSYGHKVSFDNVRDEAEAKNILPDPQTNGGLLISVSEEALAAVKEVFQQFGLNDFMTSIGRMQIAGEKAVVVKD